MKNPLKKHEFQDKFGEYAAQHKLSKKVQILRDDFAKFDQNHAQQLEGKRFDALVHRYNAIDKLIAEGIKSSAGAVKSDFGYQRSPELTKAFDGVCLWKAVLLCVTRNALLTEKIHKLSQRCGITVPPRESLTRKGVLRILSAAQIRKRCVIRDDGERCAKWLEGLALEASIDNPDSEWESILKQMINTARSKKVNQRPSYIMKGERKGLDYIEVPTEKWYYDPEQKEVYEFCEGLFLAHPALLDKVHHFSLQGILKKKQGGTSGDRGPETRIHTTACPRPKQTSDLEEDRQKEKHQGMASASQQETPPTSLGRQQPPRDRSHRRDIQGRRNNQ